MTRITLGEGDITDEAVDAIVNAANSALVLGSGVAGAINRKGGPAVGEACAAHGPIEVGEAAVTTAGDLPAGCVIHAAGMPPGGQVTEDALRRTLHASLALAEEQGCRTVAFPAIGAGGGSHSRSAARAASASSGASRSAARRAPSRRSASSSSGSPPIGYSRW